MRYSVHTMSGSMYIIDDGEMTWKRRNNNLGHEEILYFNHDSGTFPVAPDVAIMEPMYITLPDGGYIRTSPVVRIEMLDE